MVYKDAKLLFPFPIKTKGDRNSCGHPLLVIKTLLLQLKKIEVPFQSINSLPIDFWGDVIRCELLQIS